MSDKRRLSIDLDEIERQLRQGAPQGANAGQKTDPLAELARIVGQDDPFGALLDENAPQQARTARPAPRQAPRQAPPPADPYAQDPYARDPYSEDPRAAYAARGFAVDENGRAAARPDPRAAQAQTPYTADPYADEDYADDADDDRYDDTYDDDWEDATAPHARDDAADWTGGARRPANALPTEDDEIYDDAGYEDDYEDEAPRRGLRKSVVTAVALVAVGVVGIGTALWFAGSVDQAPSEPPLIVADPEPVRVEPADPGGREIPNQDTALLNSGNEGETTVVDREEQPIDLSGQTGPRVVLPGPTGQQQQQAPSGDPIATALGDAGLAPLDSGLQTPLEPSTAVAALGEPRRVRTVTVRPDGTIVGPVSSSPAPSSPAPSSPQAAAAAPAAAPAPIEPIETTAATPSVDSPSPDLPVAGTDAAAPAPLAAVPLPPQVPPRAAPTAPAAPAPTTAPAAAPSPAPLQLSALPQAQAPAAAQQPAAPTGGYAVQLAIRGSEDRARQAFDQIRGQYSSIIGDGQPIIRQAVVNGNTIYRVRVGPYSLERANQACEQIKAAAGDCFVAPNR